MSKKKKIIIYVTTVLVSVFLIFIGHKIAGSNISTVSNDSGMELLTGRITEIDVKGNDIIFSLKVESGKKKDQVVKAIFDDFTASKIRTVQPGDHVIVSSGSDNPNVKYQFHDYVRSDAMIELVVIFFIAIIMYAGLKGVSTVISLILTTAAIFLVLLPAILSRYNVYLWGSLVALFIIIMTLLLVHGPNKKSLCSGLGIVLGLIVSVIIMFFSSQFMFFSGLGSEEIFFLAQSTQDNPLDFAAIQYTMILIGALGAVMDVAMSVSSSLYELKQQKPNVTRKELLKSGYEVGKDINGTMANTLILAYMASGFISIISVVMFNFDLYSTLNRESFIFEIFQPIIGSFGILAALPLTTLICALIYSHEKKGKYAYKGPKLLGSPQPTKEVNK